MLNDWPPDIRLAVPAKVVRLCAPFTSKDPTRYYLAGIAFEHAANGDGIIAVATDSYILGCALSNDAILETPNGYTPIVRIPKPLLRELSFTRLNARLPALQRYI